MQPDGLEEAGGAASRTGEGREVVREGGVEGGQGDGVADNAQVRVLPASPEAAKAEELGMQPDPERTRLAFELEANGAVDGLQRYVDDRYRMPTDDQVEASRPAIRELTAGGVVHALLPLRERQRTLDETLRYLTERLPPGNITVMDAGSSEDALAPVREHGGHLTLVNQHDVLAALDWPRLLQILKLEERPTGKGTTVLALFLWMRALREVMGNGPQNSVFFQTDTDISRKYFEYDPLDRLMMPFVHERSRVLAVKTAMGGRGNETVMAARTLLQVLAIAPDIPAHIRQRASFLLRALLPHKWMLTGELTYTDGAAMRRPVATSYFDETLAAVAFEDEGAGGGRRVLHVGNPRARLDLPNEDEKEQSMMQLLAAGLHMLVHFGTPLTHMNLEQLEVVNGLMSRVNLVALIHGPHEIPLGTRDRRNDPVQVRKVKQDRIFPSVNLLVEENLVDLDQLVRLVRATRR